METDPNDLGDPITEDDTDPEGLERAGDDAGTEVPEPDTDSTD